MYLHLYYGHVLDDKYIIIFKPLFKVSEYVNRYSACNKKSNIVTISSYIPEERASNILIIRGRVDKYFIFRDKPFSLQALISTSLVRMFVRSGRILQVKFEPLADCDGILHFYVDLVVKQ